MTTAQAVLGVLCLGVGLALILASNHIARSSRRRQIPLTAARTLWVASGVLLATNGALQLVLAFAS